MITVRTPSLPAGMKDWPVRGVLLAYVREHAPDLAIRKGATTDGKAAYGARFMWRGEVIEAEAIEGPGCADPHETIVRHCAWLLWSRLRVGVGYNDPERDQKERAIVLARLEGDIPRAEHLERELVLQNASARADTREPYAARK